jgi:acetyl esterase/lipase
MIENATESSRAAPRARRNGIYLGMLLVAVAGVICGCSSNAADRAASRRHASTTNTSRAPIVGTSIEYKPGLRADLYRPAGKGPFPAVLLMHGGAFQTGNRSYFSAYARQLADAGIVAATIDYTLNAGYEVPIADTVDAYAWLKRQTDVDPSRIALVGFSAGAYLAERVGFPQRARAIVAIASYDITFPPGVDNNAPKLVVVGTADSMAPLPKVQAWIDQLNNFGVPVEAVVIDGAGHFDIVLREWDTIQAWLVHQLAPVR